MRRLWLTLLILAGIALAQNIALSLQAASYHRWCRSVHETTPC